MNALALAMVLFAAFPAGSTVIGPDASAEGDLPNIADVEHWSWISFPGISPRGEETRFRNGRVEIPLASSPEASTKIYFRHPVVRRAALVAGEYPKLILSMRLGPESNAAMAQHVRVEATAEGLRVGMPRSLHGPVNPPAPPPALPEPDGEPTVAGLAVEGADAGPTEPEGTLVDLPAPVQETAVTVPSVDGSGARWAWLGWLPVALLAFAAWIWKRTRRVDSPGERVRLLSSCGVGHRGQLLVAEVEGRRYFLAAGDRGINVLDAWSTDPSSEPGSLPSSAPGRLSSSFDFADDEPADNQNVSGLLELRRLAEERRSATGMGSYTAAAHAAGERIG